MVLKDERTHLDAELKVRLQVYENYSDHVNDEPVLATCNSRDNAVDAEAKRVDFQPFLARQGRKRAKAVVLVEQLSRGIGPRID